MTRPQARIALIHATPVAVSPVADAFARLWPEAEIYNLLDDSLAADLASAGKLTDRMYERFLSLGEYVARDGADGILFTCSAFGACIENVSAKLAPLPVLKPNEGMFSEALDAGTRVGMIATFAPSLPSMAAEFEEMARDRKVEATLKSVCVPDALDALKAEDAATHNQLVADASADLEDCDVILLAQFSTAQAQEAASRTTSIPILTSPDSAVRHLIKELS